MNPSAATLRDAALIFLAATVLGLGFNAASPFGVRPAPGPAVPPPATPPSRGLHHETLSFTIERSASAAPTPPPTGKAPVTVTWPQAKSLLEQGKAVLVDAREATAFAVGHIPGALSLPMNFTDAQLAALKERCPPDKTVIVYCTSSQCPISRALAQQLMERHGFRDVRDLPGGYAEWRLLEYAAGGKAAL
jgi:rhodanese-related sulfurtransferase